MPTTTTIPPPTWTAAACHHAETDLPTHGHGHVDVACKLSSLPPTLPHVCCHCHVYSLCHPTPTFSQTTTTYPDHYPSWDLLVLPHLGTGTLPRTGTSQFCPVPVAEHATTIPQLPPTQLLLTPGGKGHTPHPGHLQTFCRQAVAVLFFFLPAANISHLPSVTVLPTTPAYPQADGPCSVLYMLLPHPLPATYVPPTYYMRSEVCHAQSITGQTCKVDRPCPMRSHAKDLTRLWDHNPTARLTPTTTTACQPSGTCQ